MPLGLLEELGIVNPSIRERLIADQSNRIDRYLTDRTRVLQDARRAGLFPDTYISSLRAAKERLRDDLGVVRRQNEAERVDREAFKKLTPLERQRRLRRPNAPIEGILERERLQRARLSREAFARAKALAASRRRMLFSRKGDKVAPVRAEIEKHWLRDEGGLCSWWHNRKVMRKSVIIAKRLRRGPHSRFEERHARKHTKKFVMEMLCGSA